MPREIGMSDQTLASLRVQSEDDAVAYLYWLAERQRQYHLDDDPRDIVWEGSPLSEEATSHMARLHEELWAACNPWELFDKHPDLWNRYIST
jgi:hypothetical protein